MKNKLRIDHTAKQITTVPLESVTQARIVKRLKALGWLVVRNRGVDVAGWPDLTAYKNGIAFFVEVKRTPDDVPTPIQEYVHKKLRDAGFVVHVWDCTTIEKMDIHLK